MKKFDKDGDGKLSDDEKAELRKAMASRGGRLLFLHCGNEINPVPENNGGSMPLTATRILAECIFSARI